MTIEDQLKQEILSRYKSVRAFTTALQIPYSTLDSVFRRGIENAGIGTMLRVFGALDLDIESIQSGELRPKPPAQNKISPAPAEANTREISMEESNNLLISMGFIEPGGQLSDRDLAFLEKLVGLLDDWFSAK